MRKRWKCQMSAIIWFLENEAVKHKTWGEVKVILL